MNHSSSFRFLLLLLLVCLGCGGETIRHDDRTAYSPAALAEELAYRFKAAKSAQAKKSAPKAKTIPGDPDEQVATKAADDAAKAEPNASVETVVAETLKKVDKITAKPKTEILREIIDHLKKQPTLSPAEQDELAQKLHPSP